MHSHFWDDYGLLVIGFGVIVAIFVGIGLYAYKVDKDYYRFINQCIAEGKIVVPNDGSALCLPPENAPRYAG